MFIEKTNPLNFGLCYSFMASYISSLLQSIRPFSDEGLGDWFKRGYLNT